MLQAKYSFGHLAAYIHPLPFICCELQRATLQKEKKNVYKINNLGCLRGFPNNLDNYPFEIY